MTLRTAESVLGGPEGGVVGRTAGAAERPVPDRTFDGVICFGGEDWWYHNRGHYDMQMMRELSRDVPVLYVNSIGMRVPRVGEGAMFVKRIRRKLKSFRRGLVRVRENFAVFSPVAAPGRVGAAVTKRLLPIQVRRAAAEMGIRRPLVWVACPPGVQAYAALRPVAGVYQRTDRFEAFSGVRREQILAYDAELKARCDLVLYCSRAFFEEESRTLASAVYVDHGVDYERFASAGRDPASEPADVRDISRPRIGFVGGIDAHTFDPELFVQVAKLLPEMRFVLVGACSLPEGWCDAPNVHLLGQRPYDAVPGYMAACDVLIMPWNRSEWIKACNPVKLKEYLAVGRPVVTTEFDELRAYREFVRVATTAEGFAEAIRNALAEPESAERLRSRVSDHTWRAKADAVLRALAERGVAPARE